MAWRLQLARRLCAAAASSPAAPTSRPARRASHPLVWRLVQAESVADEMDTWLRERKPTSVVQLFSSVRALRRYGNHSGALELLDWMKERGMPMKPGTHGVRLDLIAKGKGIDEAERYFSSLPPSAKTKHTYGALLTGYTQSKMEQKSLSLFSEMQRLDFLQDSLPYNNLMALFMSLDQPQKIPDLFSQMKARGITPCSVSYSILAKASESLKDAELFERVVTEVRGDPRLDADWHLCTVFATVYGSFGKSEEAVSELKKLEERMNKSEREPYHFLITLYGGVVCCRSVWPMLLLCSSYPSIISKSCNK